VRNELRAGKIATLALGLGAGVAAWATDDLVALLGTFAFGTFAAGLGPALVLGLHWDRVGARTAVAAITVGTAGSLALEWVGRGWLPAGVPPSAPALAASTLVVLAGGWWKGSDARRRLDPVTRAALRL
jgi:Na+(H+)/acetate symporter ActP